MKMIIIKTISSNNNNRQNNRINKILILFNYSTNYNNMNSKISNNRKISHNQISNNLVIIQNQMIYLTLTPLNSHINNNNNPIVMVLI